MAQLGKPISPGGSKEQLAAWEARARTDEAWTAEEVNDLLAELRRLHHRVGPPRITRSPGRCGGYPTVSGTRIGVHHIIALAGRYGWDLSRLREEEFPDLSREEVDLAIEYYRSHEEEIEEALQRNQEALREIRLASSKG